MTTWPASIATATSGGEGMAADFNTHRDALNTIGGAWQTYTPVLTSTGTAPTIGNSSITGRYLITGQTGTCHINLTIGSTFAAGTGSYQLTLPPAFTPLLNGLSECMGYATVRDTSVPSTTPMTVYYFSSTRVALTSPTAVGLSGTAPYTLAVGDVISLHLPEIELA